MSKLAVSSAEQGLPFKEGQTHLKSETMKTLQLAALLTAIGFTAGMVTAGAAGYGPLAYISYTIMAPHPGHTVAAHIDLGSLKPGQSGNKTAEAKLNVTSPGNYTIILLHAEKLSEAFSNFTVKVTLTSASFSHTVILTPDEDRATLQLDASIYNVTITVFYHVSTTPEGDLKAFHEPLLVIHPQGEDNENESD